MKQPLIPNVANRRSTKVATKGSRNGLVVWPAFVGIQLLAVIIIVRPTARAQEPPAPPCFIAFVHGSGENHHDEAPGVASPAIDRYWSADGSSAQSFIDGLVAARAEASSACMVWRVGYDGNQSWWSDRAAGRVAASLNDFIERHDIPDGALTLVGHSMGGLIVRYVVNSGSPSAPYFNEYKWRDARMDYERVRRKTGRILSVQAPNTGAQSADALFGDADHGVTNRGADLIKALGWRSATPATAVMTRAYLEAAGSWGGEMGDEGRQAPLYTIAGLDTGDASGTGMDDDKKLGLAWALLCYKRGAANSWGAACRWDVWNFGAVDGDGLVERASAHGLWQRGSPNGTPAILGARRPWLDVIHNHNHGRYNMHAAEVRDVITGQARVDRLGTFVGAHLP